ncbi:MAG TPA: ATP phosphoribosyltransferase [Clostridia bacterium]|jgi:ATP phosphoribosyltransferase|nr:ATP phosphoribosyltransferase [Clostridia bacterium]HQA96771.1 ATP phosphoribosyltransferase [Clostridia bacterium]HQO56137.1 ATP phosphoribosyltransferase [Clostridia bacterium]
MKDGLRIALPKGRLGKKACDILSKIGYGCDEMLKESRKLVFYDQEKGNTYFLVKPSDVATYVEYGAADIGFVGRDILLENRSDVFELCDLGIGKCRICVAGERDFPYHEKKHLKVATIFPNISRDFFLSTGKTVDIISLHGSIEIAPLVKLSDVIVDIVETGATLKENNLTVLEEIFAISARYIANKVSYTYKNREICKIHELLEKVRGEGND